LGTDEAINLTIRSSLQRDDFEKRKRRGRKILFFAITFVYLPFFAAVVYKSWGVKPEDHWLNHIDDDAKYYEKKYFEKMEQINESFKKKVNVHLFRIQPIHPFLYSIFPSLFH